MLAPFCAVAQNSSPPMKPASTPTETATIYFYRLRLAYGALLKPSIFCDKKQMVRMRNGRFASMTVPSGEHTITSNLPGSGVIIDFKPGETYYVRLGISTAGLFHGGRGEVFEVTPGQGKFEVNQLKPVEPEDLKHEEAAPPKAD